MLQSISWKEFLLTVGLGLAIYYGWWLVRYYPGLRKSRKDRGAPGRDRPGEG